MISVIVPVYNVEKYIDECVESLVNQTYTDIEIILVDDGSTDSSGHKLDLWAKKDNRIKVIHQQNTGGARGGVITGINTATGDYIAFLDSDDWYALNAMEILAEKTASIDADCYQFEHYNVIDSRIEKASHKTFEIMEKEKLQQQVLGDYFRYGVMSKTQWSYGRWDKLYKTSVLKSIIPQLNPAVTIYEDFDMNLHFANICEKAVVLENCHLYYWRHIGGSISKRMIDKTIDEHILFLNEAEKFARENNFDCSGIKKFRDNVYVDLMVMALFNNLTISKKQEYLRRLKNLINDKNNISVFADNHAIVTRSALKYLSHFDTFVPSVLSQIYLKIKK